MAPLHDDPVAPLRDDPVAPLRDGVGGRDADFLEFIVPPTLGGRCALCQAPFRIGDPYKSVWPRGEPRQVVKLGISVHLGCFAQLAPGDLTRIFAALRRRLALPIAVLNGRRVEVGSWGCPLAPDPRPLAPRPKGAEHG
jgi:hypothetical protein